MVVRLSFIKRRKMRYLLTAQQMRAADSATSRVIGISSLVLMERAALAVADAVLPPGGPENNRPPRIAVVAGSGNNGADGIAAGRILTDRGCKVRFYKTGRQDNEKGSAMEKQLSIIHAYGLTEETFSETTLFDFRPEVIIDAMFGIGLSRRIEGTAERAVHAVESLRRMHGSRVIAVDLPSGISADDGSILGCAVRADETVTFGFLKRGQLLYPGCEYCGKITLADIGITERGLQIGLQGGAAGAPQELLPTAAKRDFNKSLSIVAEGKLTELLMFTYDVERAANLLPPRDPAGNKGTFGKVLAIAGSCNMCGAALLCAESAARSGAGMVKLFTEECNRVIVQTKLPELLLDTYEPEELLDEATRPAVFDRLAKSLAWADTILLGPGLGRSDASQWLVTFTLAWLAKTYGIAAGSETATDSDAGAGSGTVGTATVTGTGNETSGKMPGAVHKECSGGMETPARDKREAAGETAVPRCRGVVIDADAIRIIGSMKELTELLTKVGKATSVVLTPHMAECAALLGTTVTGLRTNTAEKVQRFAREYHCSILCKDARSIGATWHDDRIYLNVSGNDGLATAGSGDVLAGMCAGFLAQGMEGFSALTAAAWLHGKAAELAEWSGSPAVFPEGSAKGRLQSCCGNEGWKAETVGSSGSEGKLEGRHGNTRTLMAGDLIRAMEELYYES